MALPSGFGTLKAAPAAVLMVLAGTQHRHDHWCFCTELDGAWYAAIFFEAQTTSPDRNTDVNLASNNQKYLQQCE